MPRDGAIIFCDIVGKLAVLRIICDKCGRSGQYRVDRLIIRYGIDAKLFDWSDEPRPTARGSRRELEQPAPRTVPRSAKSCVTFGARRRTMP